MASAADSPCGKEQHHVRIAALLDNCRPRPLRHCRSFSGLRCLHGYAPALPAPTNRACAPEVLRDRGNGESRFPRSPAKTPAGGSNRVAGGIAMSRKPSTAALDSFGHRLFPIRRRAPRHSAGESISISSDHADERVLLFRRPGLQPRRKTTKTNWALAPEDTLFLLSQQKSKE